MENYETKENIQKYYAKCEYEIKMKWNVNKN